MPKFIVDLSLDGCESEEEQAKACEEFINEQLDFSASSVNVYPISDEFVAALGDILKFSSPNAETVVTVQKFYELIS